MSDLVERFLNQLHHPTLAAIDLSLDRMHRLLGMLGSPHKRLPPVIHVAGTNGKGSLIANLQAIFEAAGYRVHRYTSPHLVHFRERILLAGKPVDDKKLESVLKHLASVLTAQPATFFEATTAAAFLAFAEQPADVLLMETGMGGRLDATNVIETPALTAITPISYDHCEFLGNTLDKIAREKAGILKKNVPCVIGRQEQEAAQVFADAAVALNIPLYRMNHEWRWKEEGGMAIYHCAHRRLAFAPALAGRHQYDNAATAIACCDQLPQFNFTDAQIAQGIASATWPARLQPITKGAYRRAMAGHIELWLDGGHNPAGGVALADWLKEQQGRERYLICGMLANKDASGYLKSLAPHVTAIYTVTIPGESQSQTAEKLASSAKALGMDATGCKSVENALQTIMGRAKTPAIVCICGSLYLAGKVLAANGE